MRNILITGANGQLGNELRIVTKGCVSGDHFFFTDITEASAESIAMLRKLGGYDIDTGTSKLDITDIEAVRHWVKDHAISIIINCAAYTNVDAAEENSDIAELINAKAPDNLAKVMKEVNGLLIHISTDYVFGKEPYNTPCREDQKGTPTGVYGLSKLHGEENIKVSGCNYIIIRTAWLYSEFGKNFFKTMLSLTASKPQLKVIFDQIGTPTYALDLAKTIVVLLSNPVKGTYNFSNEGVCSWFDFSKMIAQYAGNYACDIQPCHSKDFPSKVIRPAYSVLDKTKIKETYGFKIPYWTDSLITCMHNYMR